MITCSFSQLSSVDGSSIDFLLKQSVNFEFFPAVPFLKIRSELVSLGISLVVRCIARRLGCVQLIVLKLGVWCKDVLLYRINRNEFSLVNIPLLIGLTFPLTGCFRDCSNICRRMLLVGLCCRFVFAVELFCVRFYSHRFLLYYLRLSRNVLSMVFMFSNAFFRSNLLLLFRSIFIPFSFAMTVSFGQFFSKVWV